MSIVKRTRRLVDVFMMMFLFQVWPEQTYRFSTRKGLPPPKLKFALQEKPTFPQEIIESRTSSIPRVKKANIVFKGSFDIEKLIELEPPIYIAGFESLADAIISNPVN